MAYGTATLAGTYKTFDDQPAEGVVEIIPNSRQLIDAEGNEILAGRVKVTLDAAGSFSVILPATDDTTIEPATGRQYTVVAKLRHTHLPAITGVELATGTTVNVADVSAQPETDALVSPAVTTTQLEAGYVAKATTTSGTVVSTGDNYPVKFATPSGAHWQLNTQTSTVDTNDHLFRRVYNYDLTGSNKREVDDVAVREALETNYQGVFEWNLDLHADNNTLDLTAPFRPLFYTYEWATGASRWVFTGQTFAQQNRDAISLIVAPYSNTQDAPAFAATKADGTTQFAYMSVKNGSYFGAPSAAVAALTARGTTGQTARIFQALDAAGAEGVAVAANGELVSNNTVYFFGKTAATIPLRVQGKSGQTANLINVIDNGANPLFDITPEGRPWIRNGGRGILMHSPAGTKYEVTVNNSGALVVTAV